MPFTFGSSGRSFCRPTKSCSSVMVSTIMSADGLSRSSLTTFEGTVLAPQPLRLINFDVLLNGVNEAFAHVCGRDGQFRDFAERNNRVFVIVRLNGRLRAVCEHARAVRCDEQELNRLGILSMQSSTVTRAMQCSFCKLVWKRRPRRGESTILHDAHIGYMFLDVLANREIRQH